MKRERCQPSSNNLKDISVETIAAGAVNDSFLHRYNKRPRLRMVTKGRMRTKNEKGVEAEPDKRPRSVKMRNDEGTVRMTPRRRVGGYCSVERPEISRERSPEESISRLDTREIEIVSRERKLEDSD